MIDMYNSTTTAFVLQILSNMCKQGFDDALRFLHRNNLLNCTRCLAVQSTFVVSETLDESMEYDPECLECKLHRQVRLSIIKENDCQIKIEIFLSFTVFSNHQFSRNQRFASINLSLSMFSQSLIFRFS